MLCHMKSPLSASAFSLVELSIVLVILGLLTGGILGGQSLIRAAELRSVATDYSRYATAKNTFRDKYFSMPGDFQDATRFWGRSSASAWCVTNSSAAVNAATGVCDGNGDGRLANAAAASQSGELFQFWRQLANAGLIEGTYDGLAGAGGAVDHDYGTNSPRAKISSTGWGASYDNNAGGATSGVFRLDYTNSFVVGRDDTAWADGQSMKPEEVWNIDTKMDDGRPHLGKVHAYPFGNNCTTAASNTDTSGDYALNLSTTTCSPIFRE
ncbi:MAG: hypothetical protein DI582_09285 [Azospirillum brasilense]|nr:MAG: hypothetical protein DI582_09285 [Azospirillum brasilense]